MLTRYAGPRSTSRAAVPRWRAPRPGRERRWRSDVARIIAEVRRDGDAALLRLRSASTA
jgi:hypothetical protein